MVDHQPAPKMLHRIDTTASSLDTISRPAVFFDRDGVLNVNLGFVYLPEDFQWIDGAIKTIKYFNNAKYLVFVVTNQSGVARGYYTENDVQQLHKWMNAELAKQAAHIDAFYYCPHYPDAKLEQYREVCQCRKPMPGLIQQAIREWPVKPTKSFLIGDMDTDLKAAATAGIKGYLFNEENLFNFSTRVGLIKQ
ncbi:D-glycero-beta-D-manno-heptose-1,7-bisphosphate 7-phosphatase [Sporomusa silvacetica DSM 10669]|uniref:D,D-heptose 1,7-bisphosphate phosphatase n=2 Tax=Sporomusa silvacetica TaxID=55504 RepID=A0ABZ3IUZ1_9FIRM|nr:D-glycero-alpha-D-manno-heptose-1,7-bisphosphate 7-phosphatase [Sporomusa silvacetica DSM 10669]